jgi:amino acid adenylation domain-containing protein/non-ribosomal peptide synthase protein (TIGR01720 family)
MYKTGDLCKFGSDGNIEYIGRIDFQVKLRGFRIELGEIEAVMRSFASVEDSAALIKSNQLIGYVLVANPATFDSAQLRSHLEAKLPSFMVPTFIVPMDKFPITGSGKLDRAAMPDPSTSRDLASYVAPRNAVEATLCEIWKSVLGLKQDVGINDNFFELGGDSIMSIQVVSRATQANIGLTVKSIFTRKTIANLALQVGAVVESNADQGFLTGPTPLLPAVAWFLDTQQQHIPNSNHFNQAEYLALPEAIHHVNAQDMKQVLLHLISHHDALRLRLNGVQMEYGTDSNLAYQLIEVSKLPSADSLLALISQAQSSLSLSTGQIVSALHLRSAEPASDKLLLIVHHIAIDGISWRILNEDFQIAIKQRSAGKPISLPPKTLSLRQWSSQWSAFTKSPESQAHLDTWKNLTTQKSTSLRNPQKPAAFSSAANLHQIKVELSEEVTKSLLSMVTTTFRAQINDILLTCLAIAFADLTTQPMLSFTLEGHGRESCSDAVPMDASRTIGWFTSVFPVTLEVSNSQDATKRLLETLKLTKDRLRIIPHKGASFGYFKYQHMISPSDAISDASALMQTEDSWDEILFNFLGNFASSFDSVGDLVDPSASFPRLVDINALVRDGRMQFNWAFAEWDLFRADIRDSLPGLPQALLHLLEALVQQATDQETNIVSTVTRSDFLSLPSTVSQEQLDRIVLSSGHNSTAIEDAYAMTPLQQGMLFHTLMEPQSEQYITQLKWTLDKRTLDVERFKLAWQTVIARHAILRTQFSWEHSEKPLQLVIDPKHIELHWSSAEVENREQLLEFLKEDRRRGFDLKRAPLIRFTWVSQHFGSNPNNVEFIWTHHHMYLDGWSVAIVLNEVLNAYASTQVLPPISAHFREFVAWMDQQPPLDAEKYWRARLAGITAATPLPNTKSSIPSHSHLKQHFTLSAAATDVLQIFVKRHQLTINTVLQTAWALLLAAYSRERSVLFGSTVSGRSGSLRGIESMVGMFINTIPVLVKLDHDEKTIIEILRAVQEDSMDASQFDHASLATIQTWTDLPKGMSLFDSLLVYENYPAVGDDSDGRKLAILDQEAFEKTSMALTVVAGIEHDAKKAPEMQIQFMFDSGRFSAQAIDYIGKQFVHLIGALSNGDVDRQLSQFEFTSSKDLEIIHNWNDKARSDEWQDPKHCVHDLFEHRAYEFPDAIAAVFNDEHITFGALNARANQLAHFLLRRCHVAPGQSIGICVERGFTMMVAILATLKIGSGYVPIDPTYPQARKTHILLDSRSALMLTESYVGFADPTVEDPSTLPARLDLDLLWPVIIDEVLNPDAIKNLKLPVPSSAPIYTIYTSGSTGKPKGVTNTHSNVICRLEWLNRVGHFTRNDRSLVRTSLCFDFSTWELYLPLMEGSPMILAPTSKEKEVDALVNLVQQQHVTVLDSIPSMMLGMVLLPDTVAKFKGSVRLWMVGGEAIPPALQKYYYPPDQFVEDIWNVYGPTEATMYTTIFSSLQHNTQSFSAGPRLDYTGVYVVDRHSHHLPIYMPGELLIGGAGLAIGYQNRPALTAATFVPHPHSKDPRGARVYRSGDLCRYLPNGHIEVIGRIDFQVKVRGFRIELGEIESALARAPGVVENVVVTRDISGVTNLVAYYSGTTTSPAAVKEHLKTALPPYMIPSHIVQLPALPLNFNGKVDRNLLPDPVVQVRSSEESVAHFTPLQLQLAEAWKAVLRVPHIGLDDNFFELGGDSILSIQIVAKTSQEGIKLTVKDIFTHRTILELSQHVTSKLAALGPSVVAHEAEQGAVTGKLRPTPVLHWFFRQNLKMRHHFNQAELLELSVSLTRDAALKIVEKLMFHHDMLRLRVKPSSQDTIPELEIGNFVPGSYASLLQSVDLSALNGKWSQQKLNISDVAMRTQRKLSLSEGPLARFVHFKRAEGDLLLVVIHHISVDGVSWRTLDSDIQQLSRLLSGPQSSVELTLPAKTTSFKRWSDLLFEHASSPALTAEAAYWISTLRRAPSNSIVKANVPHPTYNEVKQISVKLSETDTATLLGPLCSQYRAQINHVLLLCFAAAFLDGSGSFSFTLEGHGREESVSSADISRTVGWFTSIFPVTLDIGESFNISSISSLLKSVKEQLLSIPNKGVGYAILRDVASPSPLFTPDTEEELKSKEKIASEVSFNYLGQFHGAFASNSDDGPSLTGNAVDTHENVLRLIDVNGSVRGGVLQVDWMYAERAIDVDVPAIAERFGSYLRALAHHSREDPSAGGVTVSDFPLVAATQQVSQAQWDELIPNADASKMIEDVLPLTPMQAGMLFHSLLATADDEYITQMTWIMKKSNVDLDLLKRSWLQVIERHAILRTSFVVQGYDRPLQVLHKDAQLDWREKMLMGSDPMTPEVRKAVCDADRAAGFKFGFGLRPMRFTLVEINATEWMLMWTHHHILLDGWSAAIAINDFLTLYASRGASTLGAPSSLKHYLTWRHSALRDPQAAQTFWKRHLDGFNLATPLPSALPPSASASGHKAPVGVLQVDLTLGLTKELTDFAKRSNVTLSNVFQAVWAYLLHTYSTETDICFGNTVSGRSAPVPNLETVVGLLINTLPLRVFIERSTSIMDLLNSIKTQQLDMGEFEDSPLVDVQACSSIAKGMPLFETLFVFENYPVAASPMEALLIEEAEVQERTNFPLSVLVQNNDEGALCIRFGYSTDRYPKETVKRLANQFKIVLQQMPSAKVVSDFSTISPEEKSFLLDECNNTNAPWTDQMNLVELFEAQVRRTPDAVSFIYEDSCVTFHALNERANQLANYLVKEVGVKSEDRVVLMLNRGLPFIASMLAVSKAGGCYVPIDPAFPPARRQNMIEDAGAIVVITEDPEVDALFGHMIPVCQILPSWNFISHHSTVNLGTIIHPRSMLYMLFTSGSTGRPKGVVIEHRNLVNYIQWMKADMIKYVKPPLHPRLKHEWHEHRYLQKTSVCFDISSWELWLSTTEGGSCVILPPGGEKDPNFMAQICLDQCITTVHFVPTVFSVLMDTSIEIVSQWSNVEYLVNGGEAANPKSMAIFQALHPNCVVNNSYGPTEVTISSHGHVFDIKQDKYSVSLGLPVSNYQCFVLDPNFDLVGPGVPGELFIAGMGLGRGYHGRFGLTGSRWLPNPYHDPSNPYSTARMYATGDLVKYTDNGKVDYIRRIDFQVKFRGLRIELGEIEGVLTNHPQISQAYVQIMDFSGVKKIVAHILTANAARLDIEDVKKLCATSLPAYMVPSHYVPMEKFPVNVSGKLDRAQLPMPVEDAVDEESLVLPRNETEADLATEWQSVLKMPRLSVLDNFFELGGDSIVSIQLVSRINRRGYSFTVKDVFTHKTIAGMAQVARKAILSSAPKPDAPVHGEVAYTPIMHWWLRQDVSNRNYFNQADLIPLNIKTTNSVVSDTMAVVLHEHDALRLRLGEKWTILPASDSNCLLPVTTIHIENEQNEHEIIQSTSEKAQASLQIGTGPIVAAVHLTYHGTRNDSLVLIVHHMAIDGVSWRILSEDVPVAVAQVAQGLPVSLPTRTTSLIEWSSALQNFASSNTSLLKETASWKSVLNGVRGTSLRNNSVTKPRFEDVQNVQMALDSAITTKLISRFGSVFNVQINDILVSALVIALSAVVGNSHISLSMEGHGREADLLGLDLSRTVGWFTSIFPVSVRDLSLSDPLKDALLQHTSLTSTTSAQLLNLFKVAKQQLRSGTPNGGFGYGLLRYLNPDIAQSFDQDLKEDEEVASEILFNYLGKSDGSALGSSSLGALVDEKDHFNRLIDINAFLRNDSLEFSWTFAQANLSPSVDVPCVADLMLHVLKCFSELVDSHSASGGWTPSDFPLLADVLNQSQVDSLVNPNVEQLWPLLPMQQGLLYHALLDPSDAAYTNQIIYQLPKQTNKEALRAAWATLLERHPILRTGFAWEHDLSQSIQVVHKHASLEWRDVMVTADSEFEQEVEKARLHDLSLGFDLRVPSLNRFSLLHTDMSMKLVWTTHHLYLDGWSLSLLSQELDALYRGRKLGVPPSLTGYLDWWRNQDASAAHNFWSHALDGFTAPTPLPSASPNAASGAVSRLSSEFTASQTASLLAFARKQHVTLNTLLEAAWSLVLSAHSRESDVVFGATVSGRSTTEVPGIERMVGLFINTMPVRVTVSPSELVSDWLQRLQDRHSAAMAFEHVPLVQAQQASQVPKGQALFETIFVFENYPTSSEEDLCDQASGTPSQHLDLSNLLAFEKTNYALSVTVAVDPTTQSLVIGFIYDTGKYPHARVVESLLAQFKNSISNLALESSQHVGQVVLEDIVHSNLDLEPSETSKLDDWNLPPIHEQVEAQSSASPDAVALVLDDEQVTFGALSLRTTALAGLLLDAGVALGDVIAICMPRSIELVVSILAVLRVGATYVPIDPSYPAERQKYLASDSQAVLTLTTDATGETSHFEETLNLDRYAALLRGSQNSTLDSKFPKISPLSSPYMIYTSGTTGKPKGVPMTHAGFATRIAWLRQKMEWNESSVFLQTISSSFDPSAYELLGPLASGSRLVLARHGLQGDASYLADSIHRFHVMGMTSVPSLLAAFLASNPNTDDTMHKLSESPLLHVICGGEALPSHTAHTFRELVPNARLFNAYGPTEACIIATMLDCSTIEQASNGSSDTFCSIGTPPDRVYVKITDDSFKFVPTGATGELLVGGAGLSPGYHGRPALTAERFIPAPHGQRLYRTGDLVRLRGSDEQLEFVGRVDMQVKVRGFRVELGEIEAEIERHPSVVQAAVLVSRTASTSVQLVAFAMLSLSVTETEKTLREILARVAKSLPPHMVPATLTQLAHFPLTNNGKLDRERLSALHTSRSFDAEGFSPVTVGFRSDEASSASLGSSIAPRNEYEAIIAKVWQQILKLEALPSIHDSFFELGGDSIVSILVASQATKLGAPLTVRQLTQHRTIAAISAVALGASVAARTKPLLEAPQMDLPFEGAFPLTPIQNWFLAESSIESKHHWNHSTAIAVAKEVSSEAVKLATHALMTHHDALRLQFFNGHEAASTGWNQRYLPCSESILAQAFVAMEVTSDTEKDAMTEIESSFVLGSEDSTLFKVAFLINIDTGAQHVLFAQHHLITDSLSTRVLLEDFNTLLAHGMRLQSEPDATQAILKLLSPKSNAFSQFVQAQLKLAQDDQISVDEQAYWMNMPLYGDVDTTMELPTEIDHSLGRSVGNRLESSDTKSFTLDSSTTRQLQELARTQHGSVQDVLMSALYMAVREWKSPNGKSLIVDLESHGREQDIFQDFAMDLSRTVGWFTTVYPFAFGADLENAASHEILTSVIRSRQLVPNNGFGFGLLRQYGSPAVTEHLKYQNPQLLLNYLGEFKSDSGASSLSMGEQRASHGLRQRLLELNCSIVSGELVVNVEYCKEIHRPETIDRFGASLLASLTSLCRPSSVTTSIWIHPVDGTTLGLENLVQELQIPVNRALFPSLTLDELRATPSVPNMASRYFQMLIAQDSVGPYTVAGYSFGASVAFEVAKLLKAANLEVSSLILLDQPVLPTWTPHDDRRMTNAAVVQFGTKLLLTTLRGFGLKDQEEEDIKNNLNRVFADILETELLVSLLPFSEAMKERSISDDIVANIVESIEKYQHLGRIFNTYDWNGEANAITAPITIIRSSDNALEPHGMGWTRYGTVKTDQLVECEHYDLLKHPHLASVAKIIQSTSE